MGLWSDLKKLFRRRPMAPPAEIVAQLDAAETALANAKAKEAEHVAAEAALEQAQEHEDEAEVAAVEARSDSDDKAEHFIAALREYFGLHS